MSSQNATPISGAARSETCTQTIDCISNKLRRLSLLKGRKALDVGCGDGSLTTEVCKDFDEVYGIDVNASYVQAFQRTVAGNPKIHVLQMSADDMDFPDGYFNTVVSIESIEHIPHLAAATREMWRVLCWGGSCW